MSNISERLVFEPISGGSGEDVEKSSFQEKSFNVVEDTGVKTEIELSADDVLEKLPVGVAILDERGHIVTGNEFIRNLFGIEKGKSSKKPIFSVVSPEEEATWFEDLRRGNRKNAFMSTINYHNRLILFSVFREEVSEGRTVLGLNAVDVTHYREPLGDFEHDLKNALGSMKGGIETVVILLNKLLERSFDPDLFNPDKVRENPETMIRNLSDIRIKMATIINMASVSRSGSERLERRVEDTRHSIESYRLKKESIQLEEVVAKAVDSLTFQLKLKGINLKILEWEMDPVGRPGEFFPVPLVLGDKTRLANEVFGNILVNAIQAISMREDRYKEVKIREIVQSDISDEQKVQDIMDLKKPLEKEIVIKFDYDESCGMVSVSVSDTGVGVSREKWRKIFEREESTKIGTKYKGTGFGLDIAKKIMKRLGGDIYVIGETEEEVEERSRGSKIRPDPGATFIIKFPRIKERNH